MAATASRTLALLDLLQTHRHWPGPELATRLGVTQRTLRRDVDRLRELGYRIAATRGTGGGYRLEAGASLPPLLLTDAEAVTMAIGLRTVVSQGLVDGEHVTLTALAKLEQVLPAQLRRRVRALAEHVHTQAAPTTATVEPDLLGSLALACRDRERVRFHYVAASGAETDRCVEPHALVAERRHWFLVAWDRDRLDWRTFRADRMSRLHPTGVRDPVRDLPAADAAAFVAEAVGALRRGQRTVDVVLDLPLEEFRKQIGWWSRDTVADGTGRTRWSLSADPPAWAVSALAWIPAGVAYRLEGEADVVTTVREAASGLVTATRDG
jgi:predicted DNA-binding transcriptional regulator YafY